MSTDEWTDAGNAVNIILNYVKDGWSFNGSVANLLVGSGNNKYTIGPKGRATSEWQEVSETGSTISRQSKQNHHHIKKSFRHSNIPLKLSFFVSMNRPKRPYDSSIFFFFLGRYMAFDVHTKNFFFFWLFFFLCRWCLGERQFPHCQHGGGRRTRLIIKDQLHYNSQTKLVDGLVYKHPAA